MVRVTTRSGQRQKFSADKIRRTCLRAGASRELADRVVRDVSSRLYEGIPTRDILEMVLDDLRRFEAGEVASRYDLKNAIMRMGPAGFAFETFIAELLREYGYKASLRMKIQGRCALHEIDIVLEKGEERIMVECKYHNAGGIYTGLKEAMYTYARFLDLREGYEDGLCERFDGALLATNTRCSDEARHYSSCRGLRLLAWRYPRNAGIERLIERKGLYPVTVIHGLGEEELTGLSRANMMLLRDLAERRAEEISRLAGIPIGRARSFQSRASLILKGAT